MKKILIVDDEPEILEMLEMRLAAAGYAIIKASDGQQALEMARTQSPDLIVLDLMLPKMDGYKVCRMLKFDEKYKHIPIVLCSAKGHAADQEMGKEAGADAYFTKPFDPKALLDKINHLLNSGA